MFNFDESRYASVVNNAIALRPQIEAAVDEICKQGYSNIFFVGCGGTYAHSLPMKYWLDSSSMIENHAVIAAEFMAMGHKRFSKDSICIFSSRSGNTKEIVEAAQFCKEAGARTMVYVSNDDTPVCKFADYKFYSFAEDDCLSEAIYSYMIFAIARFMKNAGEFQDYDKFMEEYEQLTPFLLKAKEQYEPKAKQVAENLKDDTYHMVVGSGMLWGEAYDYAMCILEEMQWLKTKSIHAAEFFHGTLELVEKDMSIIMLYGEDETEPLMDRVKKFASTITDRINIFDTSVVELPFSCAVYRKIVSPLVIYAILERLSCYLEEVRHHKLTIRRYYRQMEY
ncbi:MAG: SIS domain-containing protein [Spirochaetia bacterium]|jgi:fructoselysine-6-phosphate deglycase|nr:SIS domain-containing protein [Spirochaetia bacterium]